MRAPNHVAIIMDGNGRWAKQRFLPRVEGHRRGIDSLRATVSAARRAGVRHLSVFAFSSENWKRPSDEVNTLMGYFVTALTREAKPLLEAGIRIHVVGNTTQFSSELQQAIRKAEALTEAASEMTLNILANYGGRWDIVQAAQKLASQGIEINEENMNSALSMPWAGPVDLMIRTGAEQRISNFILWQSAYAELYFSDKFWPEFREEDLLAAIEWFNTRERRYGLTGDQVKNSAN